MRGFLQIRLLSDNRFRYAQGGAGARCFRTGMLKSKAFTSFQISQEAFMRCTQWCPLLEACSSRPVCEFASSALPQQHLVAIHLSPLGAAVDFDLRTRQLEPLLTLLL